MAHYIGMAMLVSSTEHPNAGCVGELAITGRASRFDMLFTFIYNDDATDEPRVIRDYGQVVLSGNQLSFVQENTKVEYVFEILEWGM